MVIRVCLTSMVERTLSIGAGALSEDEFRQRISRASQGQIEVIFLLREGENKTDESGDVKIVRLKKIKRLPRWVSYSIICFKNLPLLMKQDVLVAPTVELDGFFVCLFCKLFRKKSMITIHGHYEEEWRTWHHYSKLRIMLNNIYARFTLKFADMIVVNDEQIKEKLIHKGVNPSRLSVRYVFVDTEKFSRKTINAKKFQEVKSTYKLPDKYVLFVGSLDECDGIMDMLEVFKRIHAELPAYKCVLIGDVKIGKELLKSRINTFIIENSFDNEIIQTGKVDHDLMPYLYYGADIIILPMHPPQAGVGRVILEALSIEIPVITTDIGVLYRGVVNGETGYRVPLGDIDLMASKAIYLLEKPDLRKKFGSNGRKLVQIKKNDINIYIDNWVNSIRSLMYES